MTTLEQKPDVTTPATYTATFTVDEMVTVLGALLREAERCEEAAARPGCSVSDFLKGHAARCREVRAALRGVAAGGV